MKKIEVLVRDKNTLILQEEAQKGDYIDLTSISNVDYTQIETVILAGKDEIYNEKLKEFAERIRLEAKQEIQAKDLEINHLKKDFQQRFEQSQQEAIYKHKLEINELQGQLNALNQRITAEVKQAKQMEESRYKDQIQSLSLELERKEKEAIAQTKDLELKHQLKVQELEQALKTMSNSIEDKLKSVQSKTEKDYQEQLNHLNQHIISLNGDKEKLELNHKIELEKKLHEKNEEYNKEKQQLKEQIDTLTELNHQLQRQKSALNVKQTGEDLEAWCNNEVLSLSLIHI